MPRPSLAELIAPGITAVVTQECQGGVVGLDGGLPAIAAEAQREAIPNIGRLLPAARTAEVAVVHCLVNRRADGRGSNGNARLFAAGRSFGGELSPGSAGGSLLPELGPLPEDLVLTRLHSIGPMGGTDLDPILRNLGIRTIIGVGVSVNVAITNSVMDAVNLGYQFVLTRDAVSGYPREYADSIIDNTLSLLATVTTTDDVLTTWSANRSESPHHG